MRRICPGQRLFYGPGCLKARDQPFFKGLFTIADLEKTPYGGFEMPPRAEQTFLQLGFSRCDQGAATENATSQSRSNSDALTALRRR